MKIFIAIIVNLLSLSAFAQKIDTIWYNNKWEQTNDVGKRHYMRSIEKINRKKYLVKDFFETKSLQMEGYYSSMSPETKDGSFNYWYRSGKKEMEVTYENNKAIKVCQYTEDGKISNEWERIKITTVVNGKIGDEFRVIERIPKFPGGEEAMKSFITQNLTYPKNLNVIGKVIVQFTVSEDGKIVSPEVISGLHPTLDALAVEVIKKMPAWSPGKQGGEFIAIKMSLPILFN